MLLSSWRRVASDNHCHHFVIGIREIWRRSAGVPPSWTSVVFSLRALLAGCLGARYTSTSDTTPASDDEEDRLTEQLPTPEETMTATLARFDEIRLEAFDAVALLPKGPDFDVTEGAIAAANIRGAIKHLQIVIKELRHLESEIEVAAEAVDTGNND
jgi:hypothetical protein